MKGKVLILTSLFATVAIVALTMFGTSATKVYCVEAQTQNIEVKLEVSGELLPQSLFNVVSPGSGIVDEINYEEGDYISEDSVLMSVEVDFSADAVQANSTSSLNTYSVAETIRRAQSSCMSILDFSSAFVHEDVAVFGAESTANTNLKSGLSGDVISLSFSQGDAVLEGATIAVIASREKTVSALIPQSEINSVNINQNCTIIVEGSETEYSGNIEKIANTVQTTSNGQKMVAIDITPASQIDALNGSDVEVSITLEKKYNVLSVDAGCLAANDTVFVVNAQGVLELREIEIGIMNDYTIEVISGIAEGEVIVKNPDRTLNAGDKVEIVDKI